MFPVKGQQHIGIEIHKYDGDGFPLQGDTAVFQLERVWSYEGTPDAGNIVESLCEVDIFRHVLEGLLFGNNGDDAGLRAFPFSMGIEEHFRETADRIEEGMIEIEINADRPDLVQYPPNFLADFLGGALVIPSPRASKIPFGMVSEKIIHVHSLTWIRFSFPQLTCFLLESFPDDQKISLLGREPPVKTFGDSVRRIARRVREAA
jgi:hypothetical protein